VETDLTAAIELVRSWKRGHGRSNSNAHEAAFWQVLAAAEQIAATEPDPEVADAVATVEEFLADVKAVSDDERAAVNLLINRASVVTVKRLREEIAELQVNARMAALRHDPRACDTCRRAGAEGFVPCQSREGPRLPEDCANYARAQAPGVTGAEPETHSIGECPGEFLCPECETKARHDMMCDEPEPERKGNP
jgi:hypothetical protein